METGDILKYDKTPKNIAAKPLEKNNLSLKSTHLNKELQKEEVCENISVKDWIHLNIGLKFNNCEITVLEET